MIMEDFENAKDKVIMGVKGVVWSFPTRKRSVRHNHEIGHALVAKLVPEADPVA